MYQCLHPRSTLSDHETGNADDYRWSLAGAVERGVDTTALERVAGR